MKILIGYDGSECADAALDDLKRAGLPANAEAHILSVAEIWLPPPPPSSFEIIEQAREVRVPSDLKRIYARGSASAEEALASAQRARERVKTSFPGWDVCADSACGSPAWELVFKADQWKPDLIVVGSHGRTALGRFVLGSVSQRVLTEARCSVRVARGGVADPNSPARIIIGIDGSPGSEVAVRAVSKRMWPANSEVKLVAVDDPLIPSYVGELIPPLAKTIEEDANEERIWSQKIRTQSSALLEGVDVKVTQVLREGDPKHELPRAAEDWAADCIFVGSTGFSNRLERFVLGSVSAAVAARAHCSVEVVRQAAT
jgi:nucleotide-binding universal stress UspA family protein